MKEMLLDILNRLINKNTINLLVFSFIFAFILYSVLITNNITNQYDGLWNGSYFFSSKPEVGAGRWVYFICDRFISGFKGEPFVSCLSITIFSIGNIIIIDLLNINKKIEQYFISVVILSTTTICCILSYKGNSYIFSLSYLFAILSAYSLIIIKNKYLSIVISITSLIISLGSFQSQIGCFCLLVVLYLIVNIDDDYSFNNYIILIAKAIVVLVISCVVYKIISDSFIKLLNVSFSYKGFDSLSIKDMLLNLPKNIAQTYVYFYKYFFGEFAINLYQKILFIPLLFIIFISLVLYSIKKHRIEILLLTFTIPICCNFTILIIDSDVLLQQTLAVSIFIPISLVISYEVLLSINSINKTLLNSITTILFFALLLGNVLTTCIDIDSMRQGKIATEYIVSSACEDLKNNNMLDTSKKYYFIGTPCNNKFFNVNELWYMSNDYAKYGDFWKNAYCLPISYQGVINNIGLNIKCNFPSNQDYNDFINSDMCKDMPCYPNNGYIKEENNCIFIKISDDYLDINN